ncbi:MAG: hypothetical protein ACOYM0_07865 [Bacteroidales bacterium]
MDRAEALEILARQEHRLRRYYSPNGLVSTGADWQATCWQFFWRD